MATMLIRTNKVPLPMQLIAQLHHKAKKDRSHEVVSLYVERVTGAPVAMLTRCINKGGEPYSVLLSLRNGDDMELLSCPQDREGNMLKTWENLVALAGVRIDISKEE